MYLRGEVVAVKLLYVETYSVCRCGYEADIPIVNPLVKPQKACAVLTLLYFGAPIPACWAQLHSGSISQFAHSGERNHRLKFNQPESSNEQVSDHLDKSKCFCTTKLGTKEGTRGN